MILALLRQRLNHSYATFLFIRVDLPTPGPKLASLTRRTDPSQIYFKNPKVWARPHAHADGNCFPADVFILN